jgi:ribosomal-protein-alanine N-acetyltransferase
MQAGFSPFPELKTARLRLRQVSDADDLAILFLRSDPEVNKFIYREKITRPEEARQFISRVNKDVADGRNFYWGISIADSPDLIGVICLWNFTEDRLQLNWDMN